MICPHRPPHHNVHIIMVSYWHFVLWCPNVWHWKHLSGLVTHVSTWMLWYPAFTEFGTLGESNVSIRVPIGLFWPSRKMQIRLTSVTLWFWNRSKISSFVRVTGSRYVIAHLQMFRILWASHFDIYEKVVQTTSAYQPQQLAVQIKQHTIIYDMLF